MNPAAKSAALVALRQAIREASQFEPLSAIQDYCLEILDEIESDEQGANLDTVTGGVVDEPLKDADAVLRALRESDLWKATERLVEAALEAEVWVEHSAHIEQENLLDAAKAVQALLGEKP